MRFIGFILKAPTRLCWVIKDKGYRKYLKNRILTNLGYDLEQWLRVEQNKHWETFLLGLDLDKLDVLEISPGSRTTWKDFNYRSYTSVQYPEFDICTMKTETLFDIIFADNVFEHLRQPYSAGDNVFKMLRHGGYFLIATPFLIRIHGAPNDYFRWTEDGMKVFLEECGFECDQILTNSWGNRKCVKANFNKWAAYGWYRRLQNEANFPVAIWAIARK